MKRLLKYLCFLFFLATPTIAFSQAIDRASYDSTGIPGACSFSSNQINLRLAPDPTPQNGNAMTCKRSRSTSTSTRRLN